MDISFKKDRFLFFFFVCLGSVLVVLLGCLVFLWKIQNEELQASRRAYVSLQISNELRQTSDDLTKMVRLYVLTGDKKYVDWYQEIISIRNGTTPRPDDYNEIYWDFVFDKSVRPTPYGKAISFKQTMKEYGFSPEEFALLNESQARSDALTSLEEEAIHVMQGLYNNGAGEYSVIGKPNPELARELVSSPLYMKEKANIMIPLSEFSKHVKERTSFKIESLKNQAVKLIIVAFLLSLLAFIVMVICLLRSTKALASAAKTNEELLLNLFPLSLAKRFQSGEQAITGKYEGTVLFMHINRFEDTLPLSTLNQVLDRVALLAEQFNVDIAKILGDTCMVVSGVGAPSSDHAIKMANFAISLQASLFKFNEETGLDLNLRMGMASGSISVGILGNKKFFYELWGNIVSLASFLEAFGEMGKIQVSEKTAESLDKQFVLEERASLEAGDLGTLKTYFLLKKK